MARASRPSSIVSLQAKKAVHTSWKNTTDPAARTAPGRAKFESRFERQFADVADPVERARRAEHARKAYFIDLSLKAAQARRSRRRASS